MASCNRCGSSVSDAAIACPECGNPQGFYQRIHSAPERPYPAPAQQTTLQGGYVQQAPYATAPPMPVYQGPAPPTQGIAIVALILNIIIWPGLGSLIAGRQIGWAQGFLFLGGILLFVFLIGIPMALGAWIWGIVTGVELINASNARPRPVY